MNFSFQTVWILLGVTMAHLILIGAASPGGEKSERIRPQNVVNEVLETSGWEKADAAEAETKLDLPGKISDFEAGDSGKAIEEPESRPSPVEAKEAELSVETPAEGTLPSPPSRVREIRSIAPLPRS